MHPKVEEGIQKMKDSFFEGGDLLENFVEDGIQHIQRTLLRHVLLYTACILLALITLTLLTGALHAYFALSYLHSTLIVLSGFSVFLLLLYLYLGQKRRTKYHHVALAHSADTEVPFDDLGQQFTEGLRSSVEGAKRSVHPKYLIQQWPLTAGLCAVGLGLFCSRFVPNTTSGQERVSTAEDEQTKQKQSFRSHARKKRRARFSPLAGALLSSLGALALKQGQAYIGRKMTEYFSKPENSLRTHLEKIYQENDPAEKMKQQRTSGQTDTVHNTWH